MQKEVFREPTGRESYQTEECVAQPELRHRGQGRFLMKETVAEDLPMLSPQMIPIRRQDLEELITGVQ